MKQKINLRLAFMALIAVIATAVGLTLVFYGLFQNQVKSDLQMNAQLLSDTELFQSIYEESDGVISEIDQTALEMLKTNNLRITWVDGDGTVLYDNDTEATSLGNHLDRPEIQKAITDGSGSSIRHSDTMNLNNFYYALRLDDGTILRVSTQARSITSLFLTVTPMILGIMVVIVLCCVLIGHLLTVQLLRPIENMAEHLDDRVKTPYYKELEPFAEKIRSQHENILGAVAARQDFTASISHELKTPLTAISGYAELIENHMIEPGQEASIAERIRHNANRLLSMINDIIRLSELDHTELKREFAPVDLYEVAQECTRDLQVSAQKKDIIMTCMGVPVTVSADKDLLKEMAENLIQNAIQYNREKGIVRVVVSIEDSHAVFRVTDTGIGIAKDQQERIFERFYRVDKSRSRETGGTGLGLAIVKHIAEIHSAKIKVESESGMGTTVTVSF